MGRLFLSGNTLPKFDTYDQALRDRLVIVPFERRFVLIPKHQHERRMDLELVLKITTNHSWRKQLMSILIHRLLHGFTAASVLDIPIRIRNFSIDSENEINSFDNWLTLTISYTSEPGNVVTLNNLYSIFVNSSNKRISKVIFSKNVSNHIALYQSQYPSTRYDTHRTTEGRIRGYSHLKIQNSETHLSDDD
ncbi:hypothetical protein HZS_5279 [Henneguya salminicola]|nr:hypothetical protein HZS_5279 [Henneguya salminicola]